MADNRSNEPQMDPAALYREEVYTDQRVGTIRRMLPVTADGSEDKARPVLYIGQATVMTPMGSLPLSFDLEAASLADALGKFGVAAQRAIEETAREIQEMRRQAASSIVIPEAGAASFKGAGGKGGIQIP